MRATSVPAAALVASLLSALFGSLVTFNVQTILGPSTGAWAGCRLCLYVSLSRRPRWLTRVDLSALILAHLPVFDEPAPARIALYLALATSVAVEGIQARRPRRSHTALMAHGCDRPLTACLQPARALGRRGCVGTFPCARPPG